jgi:hypothetical protein
MTAVEAGMSDRITKDIAEHFSNAKVGDFAEPCPGIHRVELLVTDETIDEPMRLTWVRVAFGDGREVQRMTDRDGKCVVMTKPSDRLSCKILELHEMKWTVR